MFGWLIALALLQAAPAAPPQTRSAVADQPRATATLADMAWIVGTWRSVREGGVASETYSPADGGQITGHFYETRDGKVSLMELMQIVERDGGLVYRLRHFNRDLAGWEDATRKPDEFPLLAIEGKRMFFDGITLDHSRPGKLDFWVRVTGKDGTAREIVYRYDRVK